MTAGGQLNYNSTTSFDFGLARYANSDPDGDGIPNGLDLAPSVFSDAFSDGVTAGTITRNGWTVSLSDLPTPLGVRASISGSGTRANVVVCDGGGGPERAQLDFAGETADITCGGPSANNGSMTVTAVVASPDIRLRKPPTGSPSTAVTLATGRTARLGSPVTADPNNSGPILVEFVQAIDALTDEAFGSFALDPGESADVSYPTSSTVEVTLLAGVGITVTVQGQTTVLDQVGQTAQFTVGPALTCAGRTATIYVDAQGRIVGGPGNGNRYRRQLNGTSGADVIVGTSANEEIYAKGGNDWVCGGGGNDVLEGAGGNDQLFGEAGNDTLLGEEGNDRLVGGIGADKFRGGAGTDTAIDFNPRQGDTKTGVEKF